MRRGQQAWKSGGRAHPSWREVALRHRGALEALRWPVPHCLPGEAGECGRSDAEHAAGYLGALQAVIESRIAHLHGGEHIAAACYAETVAEIAELDEIMPCGREHS